MKITELAKRDPEIPADIAKSLESLQAFNQALAKASMEQLHEIDEEEEGTSLCQR